MLKGHDVRVLSESEQDFLLPEYGILLVVLLEMILADNFDSLELQVLELRFVVAKLGFFIKWHF